MKRASILFAAFLATASAASAQSWLFGPPQKDPWKELGHNTGWIMLGLYTNGADHAPDKTWFEIVTGSGEKVNRIPVKGDRIRVLTQCDFFIAGYWKNGEANQGDPLVSPKTACLLCPASMTHARLEPDAEVVVEDITIATEDRLRGVTHVLWARVSPTK